MKPLISLCAAACLVLTTLAAPVNAAVIDLSAIDFGSSSYPNWSFNHADLGTVHIDYTAPNHALTANPVVDLYGGVDSLMLGGLMAISWDNAITDMEFRLYDLDLGEYTEFVLQTGVNLSVISSLNGSTLSGNTVTGIATDLANAGASNYISLSASGSAYTSISLFTFRPSENLYGAAGMGFGDPELVVSAGGGSNDIPEPSAIALLGLGLGCIGLMRRRRKSCPQ